MNCSLVSPFFSQAMKTWPITNLTNYVKYESWKYCERWHIVEPNKMLPNYGKQKMTHLNNCICTKGRYFVPLVWIILIYFLKSVSCITIDILTLYIYRFWHIYIYIYKVYRFIYLFVSVYMYVYIDTYIHIYIYIYIYIYSYIYIDYTKKLHFRIYICSRYNYTITLFILPNLVIILKV